MFASAFYHDAQLEEDPLDLGDMRDVTGIELLSFDAAAQSRVKGLAALCSEFCFVLAVLYQPVNKNAFWLILGAGKGQCCEHHLFKFPDVESGFVHDLQDGGHTWDPAVLTSVGEGGLTHLAFLGERFVLGIPLHVVPSRRFGVEGGRFAHRPRTGFSLPPVS